VNNDIAVLLPGLPEITRALTTDVAGYIATTDVYHTRRLCDSPAFGDVVCVSRLGGAYWHYGVYIGGGDVIHHASTNGDFGGNICIHQASLVKFLDGGQCNVCDFPSTRVFTPEETVNRARSCLNGNGYNLVFNNCEHFAVWCKTGCHTSTQVNKAVNNVLPAVAATAFKKAPVKIGKGLGRLSELPLATAVAEAGKTLLRFMRGDIDGTQCLMDLGENATTTMSTSVFAAIGQTAIPIPVVGAFVGSLVGYVLSTACYGQLVATLNAAKFAHEERLRIEKECDEAITMIRQYRAEMERVINQYLSAHSAVFHAACDQMKSALKLGDIDGFINGANQITEDLGGKVQFRNQAGFDALMDSDEALVL
jgi:hypothetical protein